jgi:hypothetical protein
MKNQRSDNRRELRGEPHDGLVVLNLSKRFADAVTTPIFSAFGIQFLEESDSPNENVSEP